MSDRFQISLKTLISWLSSLGGSHTELKKEISSGLVKFSHLPTADVLKNLETSESGLTEKEAETRLEKHGLNLIAHEKAPQWYVLLLKNFTNPFVDLVAILGVISYFLKQMDAVVIIALMVALTIMMRFIQEYRSNKAAEQLKAMVSTKATVIRRKEDLASSQQYEIDIKNLVPGDIIHLSAGDMLPGDVKLISAKDLFVNQSTLTGESMPVEKDESFKADKVENPLEMPNLCYMGTSVLNGTAKAVILSTGNQTYFGSMAKSITMRRPLTSFDIGVNKVSWLLIRFMFFLVPVVFLINGWSKGDWFEALLFSLAVAVGLTPEMLPMVVTANLAKGAVAMSRSKVIVKRLNAIQNFGAMDILCVDKTGTLTQDKIILVRYLNIDGEEKEKVLDFGYLNSFFQTGLKNLLDIAVLEYSDVKRRADLEDEFHKIDEIPFDFYRRRMSVVVAKKNQQQLLICKGAVEEVTAVCSQVETDGITSSMTPEILEKVKQLNEELNEDGLRVLAVAYQDISSESTKPAYGVKDECQLTLVGFLAFLDPPKYSTAEALANLNKSNVQVKILTGDNDRVTRKVCKWVNFKVDNVLNGPQIDKMSEEQLNIAVDNTNIFAKLTPLQKVRILLSLKTKGHTVGYLGDGINDAPALHAADIGISVDTAVDIAKEAADIIMLEKSLLFLAEGVLEGRKTFGNIIKYIKMAVSSNFGNVFSIIGASIFLPFLPMLPIQLLVQNLLYDISQTMIPFDRVDSEFLTKPRQWDPAGIAKFMIFIGPLSSVFDYITFAVMWFVFAANTPAKQALFQSGWFIEGLLSQTLIVHMIRTRKIPFIQSTASLPLLLMTIVVMGIGVYIPYTFIGTSLNLEPLPWSYFPWLIDILIGYCLLVQVVKGWFIKKFQYWL